MTFAFYEPARRRWLEERFRAEYDAKVCASWLLRAPMLQLRSVASPEPVSVVAERIVVCESPLA
jgi:hypothetical protein